MTAAPPFRVIAAPDGDAPGQWAFYLLHDGDRPLDEVAVPYAALEWAERSYPERPGVVARDVAPGRLVRLWRCEGELRAEVTVEVLSGNAVHRRSFEFPRLYGDRLGPVSGCPFPAIAGR